MCVCVCGFAARREMYIVGGYIVFKWCSDSRLVMTWGTLIWVSRFEMDTCHFFRMVFVFCRLWFYAGLLLLPEFDEIPAIAMD